MKNIYLLIALVSMLFGCDDRDSYLDSLNSKPNIYFENYRDKTVLSDSLKLSSKSSSKTRTIRIGYDDPNRNLISVDYKYNVGKGAIYQNDVPLSGNISIGNGSTELTVVPEKAGNNIIEITAKDKFSTQNSITYEIIGFDNISPISKLSVSPLKVNSPLEYLIDGSASFDRDSRFGGTVVKYKYQINDQIITVDRSSIKYIFPKAGKYNISLSVQDNDLSWSETTTVLYEVETN